MSADNATAFLRSTSEVPTAEWIYRATAKRADWAATAEALSSGFLCRVVHKKNGSHSLIPNIADVQIGDVIHVAFARKRSGRTVLEGLGSFVILGGPHPDEAGRVIHPNHDQLTLFQVKTGTPLDQLLSGTTCPRDPKLGVFTGWHVSEIDPREITFTSSMFPGMSALHEFAPPVAVTDQLELPPTSPQTETLTPSAAAQPISLPASGRFLGVDWSGSAQAGRKIWAARLVFGGDGGPTLESLDRPFSASHSADDVATDFSAWLTRQPFDAAGFDFCFGVSRTHSIQGMPTTGPAALGHWITTHYPTAESFKQALGRERKRATDSNRRVPFAPTNLRMYRQTYWGLRALAGVTDPILPWAPVAPRAVVEVLPAHVAAWLRPGCRYKGQTPQARASREQLVSALRGLGVSIAAGLEQVIFNDSEGDALDAVLGSLAAAAASAKGFAGPPHDAVTSGEGWIYSVD